MLVGVLVGLLIGLVIGALIVLRGYPWLLGRLSHADRIAFARKVHDHTRR